MKIAGHDDLGPALAVAFEILQRFVLKAGRCDGQDQKQESDHLVPQNPRRPDGHGQGMPGEMHGGADQMFATRAEEKPEVHASIVPTCNFSLGALRFRAKTADKNSEGKVLSG